MILRRCSTMLALLLPVLAACEQRSTTVLTGNPVHAREVAQLAIGRSTPTEVESVLGEPDERADDGSLVYRADAVRRTGATVGGIGLDVREEVVGSRSTTFRFADGVLTRICRARS